MAALEPSASRSAGRKPRARKHNFRLDMTPMVGVGFLLLSFFLLSAASSRSTVLQLAMPVVPQSDAEGCLCTHGVLRILLGPAHHVHYYFGLNAPNDPTVPVPVLHTTDFSAQGLRQVLLARSRELPESIVLISHGPGVRYQDMIAVLDEMNITNQRKYALTELSAADRQLLAASGLR